MKLSFHGGAREVTGSCALLETANATLIVDCGLFQGRNGDHGLNRESFHFDPEKTSAVVATHAHIDHIGRIPRLVREGFPGPIYSTAPTRDLAGPLLRDAWDVGHRHGSVIFELEDIERTLRQWHEMSYGETRHVGDMEIRLHQAGHILGSAMVEVGVGGKRLLFTGDLGNAPSVLLPPSAVMKDVHVLIIEGTYGNRAHESHEERTLKLERAIEDVAARGGALLIPAFATERTQDILFLLNQMLLNRRIPEMPVFVDSPLAVEATEIFERYPEYYHKEIQKLYREHPKLFRFRRLRFTSSVEESKAINDIPSPKAIIAGSGMMTGGRILHHAKRYLLDEKSILLIVGYQTAGSVGRRLIDGERVVRIFGEEVPVRAEIRTINGLSAHADNPQLFSFVEGLRDGLERVFVVHGEELAAFHFSQQIKDRLGVRADAPALYEEFEL